SPTTLSRRASDRSALRRGYKRHFCHIYCYRRRNCRKMLPLLCCLYTSAVQQLHYIQEHISRFSLTLRPGMSLSLGTGWCGEHRRGAVEEGSCGCGDATLGKASLGIYQSTTGGSPGGEGAKTAGQGVEVRHVQTHYRSSR